MGHDLLMMIRIRAWIVRRWMPRCPNQLCRALVQDRGSFCSRRCAELDGEEQALCS